MFWLKVINDNKIIKNCILSLNNFYISSVYDYLNNACYKLDICTPIILNKHLDNLKNFNQTVFMPDDFIEKVSFDKMAVEIY